MQTKCQVCGAPLHGPQCSYCGAVAQQPAQGIPCQQAPQMNYQQAPQMNVNVQAHPTAPYRSKTVTALLCLFLGVLGAHRFYVGKVGTGVIWLFTAGCYGIGWIIDFILILIGSFRDSEGKPLM